MLPNWTILGPLDSEGLCKKLQIFFDTYKIIHTHVEELSIRAESFLKPHLTFYPCVISRFFLLESFLVLNLKNIKIVKSRLNYEKKIPTQYEIPELGEMVEKRKEVTHNNESGSRPRFDQVTHFDNKFVFRFQLCKRSTESCNGKVWSFKTVASES